MDIAWIGHAAFRLRGREAAANLELGERGARLLARALAPG